MPRGRRAAAARMASVLYLCRFHRTSTGQKKPKGSISANRCRPAKAVEYPGSQLQLCEMSHRGVVVPTIVAEQAGDNGAGATDAAPGVVPRGPASRSGWCICRTQVIERSLVPVALTSMVVWVAVNAAPSRRGQRHRRPRAGRRRPRRRDSAQSGHWYPIVKGAGQRSATADT